MKLLKNPGSFRDPAGQVFEYGDRIIRVVNKYGKDRFQYLLDNNVIKNSIEEGF